MDYSVVEESGTEKGNFAKKMIVRESVPGNFTINK